MIALLAAFAVASVALIPLTRFLGRRVFLVAALVPLAAFVFTLVQGPTVLAGNVVSQTYEWVPELGLALSMRMDALSWVMTLIVTGVGALVMVYCRWYFSSDAEGLGRFAATLTANRPKIGRAHV